MDWKQFIAEIISSLAWPLIAIILIYIFRSEIGELFKRLGIIKYKDVELDFEKFEQQKQYLRKDMPKERRPKKEKIEIPNPMLSSLENQIFDTVEREPLAAILLSWSGIEYALVNAVNRLENLQEPLATYGSPTHTIDMLSRYGGLPSIYAELLEEMRIIRFKVSYKHDPMREITRDQALSYVRTAVDLINYLEGFGRDDGTEDDV